MATLDFSGLTDDQLIGLIRAACAEAVTRGTAVESAARDAYLSESERVSVARVAADREVERVRREEADRVAREAAEGVRRSVEQKKIADEAERERALWARRKGIAQALDAAGYAVSGDQIVVWLSSSNEKRVFLQQIGFGGITYATLYITGNGKHPPDTCELARGMSPDLRAAIPGILRAVAREWNAIKIDLVAALAWKGDAIPLKGHEQPTETAS